MCLNPRNKEYPSKIAINGVYDDHDDGGYDDDCDVHDDDDSLQ